MPWEQAPSLVFMFVTSSLLQSSVQPAIPSMLFLALLCCQNWRSGIGFTSKTWVHIPVLLQVTSMGSHLLVNFMFAVFNLKTLNP